MLSEESHAGFKVVIDYYDTVVPVMILVSGLSQRHRELNLAPIAVAISRTDWNSPGGFLGRIP